MSDHLKVLKQAYLNKNIFVFEFEAAIKLWRAFYFVQASINALLKYISIYSEFCTLCPVRYFLSWLYNKWQYNTYFEIIVFLQYRLDRNRVRRVHWQRNLRRQISIYCILWHLHFRTKSRLFNFKNIKVKVRWEWESFLLIQNKNLQNCYQLWFN